MSTPPDPVPAEVHPAEVHPMDLNIESFATPIGLLRAVAALVLLAGISFAAYGFAAGPSDMHFAIAFVGLAIAVTGYTLLGVPAARYVGGGAVVVGLGIVVLAAISYQTTRQLQVLVGGLAVAASGFTCIALPERTPRNAPNPAADDAEPVSESDPTVSSNVESAPPATVGDTPVPELLETARTLRQEGDLREAQNRLSQALDLLEAQAVATGGKVPPELYAELSKTHRELGEPERERAVLERFSQHGLSSTENDLLTRLEGSG